MAFKHILEDTLSLFSIPQFLGMSGWRLWLGRVFQTFRSSICCGRFVAVLYHVGSGHPAFSLLFNHRCLGTPGYKLWIGRFFRTSRNTIPTHLHALHVAVAPFLLTIRLGIEELVAIPSSGRNTAFFGR